MKVITETYPISNAREEEAKRNRFLIRPEELMRGERYAETKKLDVVGFYHSHPDHPAIPSERDRVGAQGVGGGSSFSFLIQSVRSGQAAELASWLLVEDGARFIAEELA